MQLHPTDIVTKNNTTWLSHSLLLQCCKGLTEAYMSKARSKYKATVYPSWRDREILPDTGTAWRWATINGAFYYAYNNIPDKAPSHYRSQLPDPKAPITNAQADTSFEDHFKTYLNSHYQTYLFKYNDCTPVQRNNLARAAAILEAALAWIREKGVDIKKYAFFQQLADLVAKFDIKYFPENPRVIKRKIEPLLQDQTLTITDIIRLPRADNDNASKGYSDEEIRSWILQLRGMEGRNFTNTYIIRKIQQACELTCKPCPSDRWIGAIMEERNTEYLTAQQRFSDGHRFAKLNRSYQPFKNALFAGDAWQIDGTRVNMVPHKHEIKGENKAAYVYMVTVRDVHSGDIVGWHFTLTEDRWAVISALQMACKETGYLPYEIIFDKFPGHNSPEGAEFLDMVRSMGVTVTMSSDWKVKAGAERWYGTLQTVFMQESAFYYGEGVKSRRTYNHRSENYVKRMSQIAWNEGFDWLTACAEANKVIEAYKVTPYAKWSRKHASVQHSPVELHTMSEKPHVRTLDADDITYLFGFRKPIQIDGRGMIKTEIQKATYYFKTMDAEIYGKHDRVLMVYDMEDLGTVCLYAISDNPIKQYLGKAVILDPAQRYGPNADWGTIAQRSAELRQQEEWREQEYEYKVANGEYDITSLIAPMSVHKHQAEANESAYLNHNPGQQVPFPGDSWNNDDNDLGDILNTAKNY